MKKLILTSILFLTTCITANPYSDCCLGGWVISGDYIYWKPRTCDLDYALLNSANAVDATVTGGPFVVDTTYSSGFRVGAAKGLGCFDIGGEYTRLRSKDSDYVNSDIINITPTLFSGASIDLTNLALSQYTEANADYSIDLDIGKIEGGYQWRNGRCMQLRSYCGAKYVRLDQHYEAFFRNGVEPDTELNRTRYDASTLLNCYGLYLGMNSDLHLFEQCRIGSIGWTGDISLGGLAALSDRRMTVSTLSDTETIEGVFLRNDTSSVIANIDLSTGLYWVPACLRNSLRLSVGYEFHGYYNTPRLMRLIQSRAATDAGQTRIGYDLEADCDAITFDGLFARLSLRF